MFQQQQKRKFNQGTGNQIKLMTEFEMEGHELPPLGSSELYPDIPEFCPLGLPVGIASSFLRFYQAFQHPFISFFFSFFFLLLVWSLLFEIKRSLTMTWGVIWVPNCMAGSGINQQSAVRWGWNCVLAPSPAYCVTLSKLLSFSEHQLLPL